MNTMLARACLIAALLGAASTLHAQKGPQNRPTTQTYDDPVATGATGYSRTVTKGPSGDTENTWYTDPNGVKKLVEVRHFNKKTPPEEISHWVRYTDPNGDEVTESFVWDDNGRQDSGTREVVNGAGKSEYEWVPATPKEKGHWKFKNSTPAPKTTEQAKPESAPEKKE